MKNCHHYIIRCEIGSNVLRYMVDFWLIFRVLICFDFNEIWVSLILCMAWHFVIGYDKNINFKCQINEN